MPFSQFSEGFGFGYYDHDFAEKLGFKLGPRTIRAYLAAHSFSASFQDAASTAAERQGLTVADVSLSSSDFGCDPIATGIKEGDSSRFLGRFP